MTTAREKAQNTAKRANATKRRRSDPLVRAEQQRKIASMWIAGASQAEIATALKISESTVQRERRRMLDASLKGRDKLADELREKELLTLDRLQRAHWTEALKGSIGSSKIVLSCVDKRAKLLGLDAPIKVDATVKSELDAQIEQLVEELESVGLVKGAHDG